MSGITIERTAAGHDSAVRTITQRPKPRPTEARGTWTGRFGLLLLGCGVVLVPWLVVLAVSLPNTTTASHWSMAWVGLDTAEAAGLIATGLLLRKGDQWCAVTATATAALLTVDAWFDVTTASSRSDMATAIVMAVVAELPLAAACMALAARALRRAA